MRSAVLFLVFNRPDTTRQVFEAIRAARPPRLYVAADGPRATRSGEIERCEEVRRIATEVDWPCELKTLFRTENLGCKVGVSSGIDWFFENEEEGIILEDDVLPLPGFFGYCDELLERYRDDQSIGQISGCNLVSKYFVPDESYFFSRYNHIWGWGSWRRAWQHYDVTMKSWPEWRDSGAIKKFSNGNIYVEGYWREIFDRAEQGLIDTWDYQWVYTCCSKNMISILPKYNQVYNLGFGQNATHTTTDAPDFVVDSVPKALLIPLTHPAKVKVNKETEALINSIVFGVSFFSFIKSRLRKIELIRRLVAMLRR